MRPANRCLLAVFIFTLACSSNGNDSAGGDNDGSDNGASDNGAQPDDDMLPDNGIARITLSPAAVTFTASGQSQALSVLAFDKDGNALPTTGLAFTSTKRDFASVDASGLVTAMSDVGSALIQVTAGNVVSNPVTALGIHTQPGVVVVGDEAIVGKPLVVDSTVRLVVRDIGTLVPGSLILGGGAIPIAGRITAVNGTTIDVVDVPLTELVRDMNLNVTYDAVEQKTIVAPLSNGVRRSVQAASKSFGPFECESDVDLSLFQAELEAALQAPTMSIEISHLIVEGVQSGTTIVARGRLDTNAKAVFRAGAAITGEVTCKATLMRLVAPVFGFASIIAVPVVPLAFEASLTAEASVAAFSIGLTDDMGILADIGFIATRTGYESAMNMDVENDFEPVVSFPAEQSPRAKVTLFAGLTAGLEVSFGNLGVYSVFGLEVAKLSAGPELEAKITGPYSAAADDSFQTGYELKGIVSGEPGEGLTELLERFAIPGGAFDLTLKFETPLGQSPQSQSLAADTSEYVAGDTVTFDVAMDYDSSTFPIVGANIREVRLYLLDWTAHTATLVASAPGSASLSYSLTWTADAAGTLVDPITGDPKFWAYVVDEALSPVSTILPFELGAFVGRPRGHHIAASGSATLWLKDNGNVYAIGRNQAGHLGGGGAVGSFFSGQQVDSGVFSLQADNWVTAVLKSDGLVTIRGWGPLVGLPGHDNPAAQLLDTTGIAIASGYDHTLVLRGDGSVFGVGDVGDGRLGANTSGTYGDTGLGPAIAIAAGALQSIAVRPDGTVYSVGSDLLGNGALSEPTATPVWAFTLERIVSVAAGDDFALALDEDGYVWAWGRNTYGQLGIGNQPGQSFPIKIDGLAGVSQISCGRYHAMALANGVAYAWGRGESGRLGQGNETDSNVPLVVLTGVREIDAGEFHSVALLNDGSLYGWGYNFDGGLGPSYGEGVKVLSPQNITF